MKMNEINEFYELAIKQNVLLWEVSQSLLEIDELLDDALDDELD